MDTGVCFFLHSDACMAILVLSQAILVPPCYFAGRTMDFTFDLNQIPVIGHKRLDLPNPDLSGDKDRGSEKGSRSGADSSNTGTDYDYVTNWAKPQLSQVRI